MKKFVALTLAIILAVVLVATAPKSNSAYSAMNAAMEDIHKMEERYQGENITSVEISAEVKKSFIAY